MAQMDHPINVQAPRSSRRPSAASALGSFALASLLMLSLSFAPFDWWFVAPFALAPLTLCVIRRPLSWPWLLHYELAGFVYFLVGLRWLHEITWPGTIALALFLGLYFVLFAVGTHRLMNHLRWPALLSVPLIWVTAEYLRSIIFTGFPWFLMGNSLAPAPPLIQIADLAGVWGVSFFIGISSGWLVDMLRLPLREQGKLNPAIIRLSGIYACVVVLVLAYGLFRLHQNTLTPGPQVAVIQYYIPQIVKDQSADDDPAIDRVVDAYHHATTPEEQSRLFEQYERLSAPKAKAFYDRQMQRIFDPYLHWSKAAALDKPDLIAWPETMVPCA